MRTHRNWMASLVNMTTDVVDTLQQARQIADLTDRLASHHLDRVETTLTDIVRSPRTDSDLPTEGEPQA